MFALTVCGDVRLCQPSDRVAVVHHLEDGVRVGVRDVGLQSAVFCPVVKAATEYEPSDFRNNEENLTRNRNLRPQILSTRSRLFGTSLELRPDHIHMWECLGPA